MQTRSSASRFSWQPLRELVRRFIGLRTICLASSAPATVRCSGRSGSGGQLVAPGCAQRSRLASADGSYWYPAGVAVARISVAADTAFDGAGRVMPRKARRAPDPRFNLVRGIQLASAACTGFGRPRLARPVFVTGATVPAALKSPFAFRFAESGLSPGGGLLYAQPPIAKVLAEQAAL